MKTITYGRGSLKLNGIFESEDFDDLGWVVINHNPNYFYLQRTEANLVNFPSAEISTLNEAAETYPSP